MNVLVVGATGGTGREIIKQLHEKGHVVTVFARDPSKFSESDRVKVAQGDVHDLSALTAAVRDQQAVLAALGPRSLGKTDVQESFAKNVIEAMHVNGVKRLVDLSAWGSGDSKPYMRTAFKLIRYTLLRNVFADKERGEELLVASDLDFTLVRPGRLTDDGTKGVLRAGLDDSEKLSISVSRRDVAQFMVDQLDTDEWIRKNPLVGY